MVVIIYFQKTGALNNQMSAILTSVLCAVVVITGLYRWKYTKNTRDPRLWHRRDFGKIAPVSKKESACPPAWDGSVTFDLNKVLPEQVTVCADQIAMGTNAKLDRWQKALSNEIAGYQSGAKVNGIDVAGIGGGICDAFSE